MHNRFNNPNVVWFATAKLPSKTLVLCPAKSMLCCPAIMAVSYTHLRATAIFFSAAPMVALIKNHLLSKKQKANYP